MLRNQSANRKPNSTRVHLLSNPVFVDVIDEIGEARDQLDRASSEIAQNGGIVIGQIRRFECGNTSGPSRWNSYWDPFRGLQMRGDDHADAHTYRGGDGGRVNLELTADQLELVAENGSGPIERAVAIVLLARRRGRGEELTHLVDDKMLAED